MIKDTFISFKDNFKERISNPFLGTYLAVWLIRNWDLIYSLFNFDDEYSLKEKIKFIESYYENHEFLVDLSINILWTFAVLITTYILMNLSRLIVNLFEKRLSPWIYQITDSKSIVKKSVHENLEKRLEAIQIRFEKEKEARIRVEDELEALEEKLAKSKTDDDKGVFIGKNKDANKETEKLSKDPGINKTQKVVQKIIEDGKEKTFLEIARKSLKKEGFNARESEKLDFFIDFELIKIISRDDVNEWFDIELSELGLIVYRQLVELESIQ
ncbi:hypothetical protein MATR_21930 [Marivirga tractuosa]|uniref:Uncharacterized protein n=1 Tax=Marivirga tractuosa (strain ATCC 23168 / DSM 4126 / NBRC 15989 / NCIMB 1408 / VKM B-1430 / H-43) TaxID=643867 RepID=E4TL53_MARTH|nr:hypothetical protein [Marivirga tractuosa]ADR20191.1 hypothetical protein Ftrac_0180 [Marivirga tractuosa DSM 4126]BDD15368.1 hypothetical protein MATR_21930 [Marivirga tractuosa]